MCTCGTGRGRVGAGLYNLLNIHIYTHVRTRVALTVTRCVERHGVCVYLCSLSRESSVCGLCDCVRAGGLWGRHLWVRRRSLWQGATGGRRPRSHPDTRGASPARQQQRSSMFCSNWDESDTKGACCVGRSRLSTRGTRETHPEQHARATA